MVKKVLDESAYLQPTFAGRGAVDDIPSTRIPDQGMAAQTAKQLCMDDLALDGNPRLNLASFVTTWMEPEAEDLIAQSLSKNLVDHDEYPRANEIEKRCVNIVANLFSSSAANLNAAVGTSTIGSSEAVMLAGLAMKWRWRQKNNITEDGSRKPNLVLGSNVQVVWEKFLRYFDVAARYIPITAEQTTITAEQVRAEVDQDTIGVVAILGVTFTGEYEPIEEIAQMLDQVEQQQGLDIPLHVDAASGGFVAPFMQPDLKWDFRLSRVVSINVSGHKYGLVYPGVGWVVWRDAIHLPKELIFNVNYLGGEMPTFNLNFSRPSAFVIAQYYNFLRLGYKGYKDILSNLEELKQYLVVGLQKFSCFKFLSQANTLPVVVVAFSKDHKSGDVFDLSDGLRKFGWIVPAYTMPENATDVAVLRFVLRESFSKDMLNILLQNIKSCLNAEDLQKNTSGKQKTC